MWVSDHSNAQSCSLFDRKQSMQQYRHHVKTPQIGYVGYAAVYPCFQEAHARQTDECAMLLNPEIQHCNKLSTDNETQTCVHIISDRFVSSFPHRILSYGKPAIALWGPSLYHPLTHMQKYMR